MLLENTLPTVVGHDAFAVGDLGAFRQALDDLGGDLVGRFRFPDQDGVTANQLAKDGDVIHDQEQARQPAFQHGQPESLALAREEQDIGQAEHTAQVVFGDRTVEPLAQEDDLFLDLQPAAQSIEHAPILGEIGVVRIRRAGDEPTHRLAGPLEGGHDLDTQFDILAAQHAGGGQKHDILLRHVLGAIHCARHIGQAKLPADINAVRNDRCLGGGQPEGLPDMLLALLGNGAVVAARQGLLHQVPGIAVMLVHGIDRLVEGQIMRPGHKGDCVAAPLHHARQGGGEHEVEMHRQHVVHHADVHAVEGAADARSGLLDRSLQSIRHPALEQLGHDRGMWASV